MVLLICSSSQTDFEIMEFQPKNWTEDDVEIAITHCGYGGVVECLCSTHILILFSLVSAEVTSTLSPVAGARQTFPSLLGMFIYYHHDLDALSHADLSFISLSFPLHRKTVMKS